MEAGPRKCLARRKCSANYSSFDYSISQRTSLEKATVRVLRQGNSLCKAPEVRGHQALLEPVPATPVLLVTAATASLLSKADGGKLGG